MFSDRRVDALALYLLVGLSVGQEVVDALSTLGRNHQQVKPVVCRPQLSDVVLTEAPPHPPVHKGLHNLGLYHDRR